MIFYLTLNKNKTNSYSSKKSNKFPFWQSMISFFSGATFDDVEYAFFMNLQKKKKSWITHKSNFKKNTM